MPTNSKCHLQFLEIYLLCTLCHIACVLVLTKPVFGLMERDREWRMLNALFEGQTLFLALLTNSLSASAMLSKGIVSLQFTNCQLKVINFYFWEPKYSNWHFNCCHSLHINWQLFKVHLNYLPLKLQCWFTYLNCLHTNSQFNCLQGLNLN